MNIDLRTLALVLGITHLMQIVVFFYQYKANKEVEGPGWWLLWSAAEMLGFIIILLRAIPFLTFPIIVIQNLVLLIGPFFIYIGIVKFLGKKVNYRLLLYTFLTFSVIHFYYIFVDDNIEIRSVNISLFFALISFFTAYQIIKYSTKSIRLTANINAVVFLIHVGIFIARAVIIVKGASVDNVFSPSLANYIPYFDALIVSLMWTFGFIMMLNQKLNAGITEAKTHFELIFKTSPDAIIITRFEDGKITDCNEGFTRITGYTRDEFIGNDTLSLPLWENPAERDRMLQIVTQKGYCENFELFFRHKKGYTCTGLLSARTLKLNGETHLLGVVRDISERKAAEEEIKSKNEQLKKLNKEKDKFFSIMAHDLRSPFASFQGLTEMINEQFHALSQARLKELLGKLNFSASNLFQLLENLLEWSRIEQGVIPFRPEITELNQIVNESLSMLIESARAKSITIETNVPSDLKVYADRYYLLSILRNLISNAIKFTPKGGTIAITAFGSENQVEVIVQDSGIGMSPELLSNIFKIDAHISRKGTEGEASSGLGLILCKSFIEKHNGSIWVESEVGAGTTFHFKIPVSKEPSL